MAAIIGFTMASCGGSGKSSGTYVTEDGMVYSFYQSSDASDSVKAAEWYQVAAEQGDTFAGNVG